MFRLELHQPQIRWTISINPPKISLCAVKLLVVSVNDETQIAGKNSAKKLRRVNTTSALFYFSSPDPL